MEPNCDRDDREEQALVALLPMLRRLARALTCDSKAADRIRRNRRLKGIASRGGLSRDGRGNAWLLERCRGSRRRTSN